MGPMLLSLLLAAHAADLDGVEPKKARDVRITSAAVGWAAGTVDRWSGAVPPRAGPSPPPR